jgi:hypothetical protein
MEIIINNQRPIWAWRHTPIALVGGEGDETVFSHLFGACMSLNKCSHDGVYSGGLLKFLTPDEIANLGLVCKEANEVVKGLKTWNGFKVENNDDLKYRYNLLKKFKKHEFSDYKYNRKHEFWIQRNELNEINKKNIIIDINFAENNRLYVKMWKDQKMYQDNLYTESLNKHNVNLKDLDEDTEGKYSHIPPQNIYTSVSRSSFPDNLSAKFSM